MLLCPISYGNFTLAIGTRGEPERKEKNDETNIEVDRSQLRMNQQHGLIK